MNQKLSLKLTNISLLLSILVVLIHSTTVVLNMPGAQTSVYGKNVDTFFQLFWSEGICRIAVPMFFMISGYLLFRNYSNTAADYGKKLKRRFFSLVLPYLFWSSAVFFAFYALQRMPGIGEYFSTRQIPQLGFGVILNDVILESFNSPLWFCRYLIVFVLCAPLFYVLTSGKAAPAVFLILFLWWLGFFAPIGGIRYDAIFFYAWGSILAKRKLPELNGKIVPVAALLWLLILAVRTSYLCTLDKAILLNGTYDRFLDYTMKAGILLGLPAAWYAYDYLPEKIQALRWPGASFSFLIFVMHHPIAAALRKIFGKFMGSATLMPTLNFILTAACSIALIILAGTLLKKVPKFYTVISGNR